MKYTSQEIMALRVGPIPQKCNVSNHGIALIYTYFALKGQYRHDQQGMDSEY